VYRWDSRQSFAVLHWFRWPRIRWENRGGIHEAFLTLVCGMACRRRLVDRALTCCQTFVNGAVATGRSVGVIMVGPEFYSRYGP
jgi:hypothetical protein